LIESGSSDLLARLYFANGNAQLLSWCVEARNNANRALARAANELPLQGEAPTDRRMLHEHIGQDRVGELKSLTESLYNMLDEGPGQVQSLIENLRSHLTKHFGERPIWKEPDPRRFLWSDFLTGKHTPAAPSPTPSDT
jgi:hypothetical protein